MDKLILQEKLEALRNCIRRIELRRTATIDELRDDADRQDIIALNLSADMDVRLSKALGTTPGYWLGLQADYDLWQARRHFKGHIRPIVESVT